MDVVQGMKDKVVRGNGGWGGLVVKHQGGGRQCWLWVAGQLPWEERRAIEDQATKGHPKSWQLLE